MITCKLCDGVHGPSGCPARSATDRREGAGERDTAREECERLQAENEKLRADLEGEAKDNDDTNDALDGAVDEANELYGALAEMRQAHALECKRRNRAEAECERLRAELDRMTTAYVQERTATLPRVQTLTAAIAHVWALLAVVDGRNVLEKTSAADAARRFLAGQEADRG